jgi:hypothetical protein
MTQYTISLKNNFQPTADDLEYLASVGMTYDRDVIKITVAHPYQLHRAKAALRMIPSQLFYDSLNDNLAMAEPSLKKKPKINVRSRTPSTCPK